MPHGWIVRSRRDTTEWALSVSRVLRRFRENKTQRCVKERTLVPLLSPDASLFKLLIRLVAGGGFEPHLAIDNTQLTDFISSIRGNKDTMSESTVQIQYTRTMMSVMAILRQLSYEGLRYRTIVAVMVGMRILASINPYQTITCNKPASSTIAGPTKGSRNSLMSAKPNVMAMGSTVRPNHHRFRASSTPTKHNIPYRAAL